MESFYHNTKAGKVYFSHKISKGDKREHKTFED